MFVNMERRDDTMGLDGPPSNSYWNMLDVAQAENFYSH